MNRDSNVNLGLEPVLFFRKGGDNVERFWDLVKESVIIQGLVTLALVGVTCYLYATGQDVPETLLTLDSLVVGFFFGAKVQGAIQRKA